MNPLNGGLILDNINLTGKRLCIFGLPGSGKTNFTKALLSTTKKALIYDTLHEYKGYDRYLPQYRDYSEESQDELNAFIKKYVTVKKGRPQFFIVDEANRYCPNRKPLPDQIGELNDFNRHFRLATGYISRRPTQLNTDLVELAHYLIFFRLTGKNDYQYMESISEGLGDEVRALEDFHYVLVDQKRDFQTCPPVKDIGVTPLM